MSDHAADLLRELAELIDAAAAAIAAESELEQGRLFVFAEASPTPIGGLEAVAALHGLIGRVIENASERDARLFFSVLIEVAARHGRRAGAWR